MIKILSEDLNGFSDKSGFWKPYENNVLQYRKYCHFDISITASLRDSSLCFSKYVNILLTCMSGSGLWMSSVLNKYGLTDRENEKKDVGKLQRNFLNSKLLTEKLTYRVSK